MDLLKSTPVDRLFPADRQNIITLSKKDLLSNAFKVLTDNKILSAPVWDQQKRAYTAFLDMVDIVSISMNSFSEAQLVSTDDIALLMDSAISVRNKTVGEVADFSHRNPYLPVEGRAPIEVAIRLMVKWAVHRIPVVDSEGSLVTVLTQSHVVHWLAEHLASFGEQPSQTLEKLGLGQNGVFSVGMTDRAVDAFMMIHSKKVSAVAVLDADGKIVGNISVSDLKVVGYDNALVTRLFYSVAEFLKVVSMTRENCHHKFSGAVKIPKSATLRDAVKAITSTHVHRVYVVDDDDKPLGVISGLEILRGLCSFV